MSDHPSRGEPTVAQIVSTAFGRSAATFAQHEPALREDCDPTAVHQARVATRRMRSDLRTFADYVDPRWAAELRAELRWLGSELGAVRDVDVMHGHLRADARELPTGEREAARRSLSRLVTDREAARGQLRHALASARYEHLRDEILAAADDPHCTSRADTPARKPLRRAANKALARVERAVRALPEVPSDAELHEVRIRAKRGRYAAEAAVPALGDPAERYARNMERIQDLLGRHQDSVLARAWLAKTAGELGGADAFALGMLAQIEARVAARARSRFPSAWRTAARDRRRRGL
jgi:CHAD domain-containing protein